MAKYTVRLSGSAPVWADVEVEAESAEEALEKAHEDNFDPAFEADWQFCEGGNGVDDWSVTGDVYLGDECVMEDGELLEACGHTGRTSIQDGVLYCKECGQNIR